MLHQTATHTWTDEELRSPAWYKALMLTERAALLHAPMRTSSSAVPDVERAARRLERWRAQAPFTDSSRFAQRLAADALTENDCFRLLGEPPELTRDRLDEAPPWLASLVEDFSASRVREAVCLRSRADRVVLQTIAHRSLDKRRRLRPREGSDDDGRSAPSQHRSARALPCDGSRRPPDIHNAHARSPEGESARDTAGFLEALAPLVRAGRERLREGARRVVHDYPAAPFGADTVDELLYADLARRLRGMIGRTMVLELHVARLEGRLQGETAAERFESFIARLRERDVALSLLREYPVLARQIVLAIEQWVACGLEFLARLCADWPAILHAFGAAANAASDAPGQLVHVDGSAGDGHRGGRSVLIVRFDTGLTVVYKPRSLAVDRHFQDLLAWVNAQGFDAPFRTLTILDRDAYGWVEFVAAADCASPEEVQRFYRRQGGYLALLYALEATDFHYENLIAAGEHPVLLDLEALFHPRIGAVDLTQADQLAGSTLAYSVLGVGLLPQRVWSNRDADGIDVSGLGARAGSTTPFGVPRWDAAGTDEMRLVRKRIALPGKRNRPVLHRQEVDALDYAETIAAGFSDIYRLLLARRDRLLADDGPIAAFARDEVRVIIRPTQLYGRLLHESFHPDVLRNALDRDRLFDHLWIAVEYWSALARVIPAERDDLLRGDIPLFTTRPTSRDLWSSTRRRIAAFYDETGMALVRRRIGQLSPDDLARQLWFVRASLATLAPGVKGGKRARYRLDEAATMPSRERLVAGARAAGDRLEALALRGERDASWVGLRLVDERYWSLAPLGSDLYDGLAGVTLFLAYLGVLTGEERYTARATAALTTVRARVQRERGLVDAIGAFEGWGGIIYTLAHLAALWRAPALLGEAAAIVDLLPPLIARDDRYDVLGGAAGCIHGLLSLYACAPSRRVLDVARQCGDRLVAKAQRMERGHGWIVPSAGSWPLTGYSHGAAGIAAALLDLASASGEESYRVAALAAVEYERSLFSVEAGNWPDLRESASAGPTSDGNGDNTPTYMTTWCHGAPGIGLARLQTLRRLDDATVREELDTALRTTLAYGFGHNHSLCHGDLGNLELLWQAGRALDGPRWRGEAGRLAAAILSGIERGGWRCGNPLGVESPGLMTGIAGIGYELLRLAEPERVPSILTLDPPCVPSAPALVQDQGASFDAVFTGSARAYGNTPLHRPATVGRLAAGAPSGDGPPQRNPSEKTLDLPEVAAHG